VFIHGRDPPPRVALRADASMKVGGLVARAVSSPNEFIASSLTLLTRANELEVPSQPGSCTEPRRRPRCAPPSGTHTRVCPTSARACKCSARERERERGRTFDGASYVYKVG